MTLWYGLMIVFACWTFGLGVAMADSDKNVVIPAYLVIVTLPALFCMAVGWWFRELPV